jgi:predicted transcriptional regulator
MEICKYKLWKKLVKRRYLGLSAIIASEGNPEKALKKTNLYLGLDRKHAHNLINLLNKEGFLTVEYYKNHQKQKKITIDSQVQELILMISRAPYDEEYQRELQLQNSVDEINIQEKWKDLVKRRYLGISAIMTSKGNLENALEKIIHYLGIDRKHAQNLIYSLVDEGYISISKSKKSKKEISKKYERLNVDSRIRELILMISRAPYKEQIQEEMQLQSTMTWISDDFHI